jgi:hypothetical protein
MALSDTTVRQGGETDLKHTTLHRAIVGPGA